MKVNIEEAFAVLSQALGDTENKINEEISLIQKQTEELEKHIILLNTQQQTLNHDRDAITEMYQRYGNSNADTSTPR